MDSELPLQGLYLHLVRSGFPVSVRDYQDALVALRRGYGSPRREDLHWLCATLWARTDQEVSRIDRLFREFRWPSADDVGAAIDGPVAPSPMRKRRSKLAPVARAAEETAREESGSLVEFAGPTESGVGLPSATTPERSAEVFILTRRPLMPLRALIIAWRRLRVTQRSGPRVELDLNATIAEQARRGYLIEPVLVQARRNQARLVVLVDRGPSMATWRHMTRLVAESLATSQLAHTAMYYFDAAPDDELYEHENVSRPVAIRDLLSQHPRSSMVIVSDAGAAMGGRDRERVARVRKFADAVKEEWSPIAWLNPMPPARWKGTSAGDIARLKTLTMYPFTDDGLIHAVDFLRGKRD
jgi:uncharacterized protein with von Willebrand factor type A (vWA) domain